MTTIPNFTPVSGLGKWHRSQISRLESSAEDAHRRIDSEYRSFLNRNAEDWSLAQPPQDPSQSLPSRGEFAAKHCKYEQDRITHLSRQKEEHRKALEEMNEQTSYIQGEMACYPSFYCRDGKCLEESLKDSPCGCATKDLVSCAACVTTAVSGTCIGYGMAGAAMLGVDAGTGACIGFGASLGSYVGCLGGGALLGFLTGAVEEGGPLSPALENICRGAICCCTLGNAIALGGAAGDGCCTASIALGATAYKISAIAAPLACATLSGMFCFCAACGDATKESARLTVSSGTPGYSVSRVQPQTPTEYQDV